MAEMMKESNTTWAGLIPDSWQSIIFSYAINNVRTGLNPRDNFELTNDDDYYYVTIRNFKDGKVFLDEKCDRIGKQAFDLIQSRSKLKKGDILFASISDEANACLIEENPKNWNINESVFSIDAKRNLFYPRYLYYLVINPAYYNDLRLDATGSTFHSIKQNKLYRSKLIMPSLNEQRIIADFLDEKCAEIDKLSEDIQKQIEILEEYKKSVITRAVTEGLDSNVRMKGSDSDWIKKVPNHWITKRIGSIYSLRATKVSDEDYPPLSVTMKGILPQLENVAKTDDHSSRKLVKKNDFVINSRSDRRGSCGISQYDGSVSLINIVLKPMTRMNNEYYNWLFHSSLFADEFYKWGHGIVDDLWTTTWQDMKTILVPVPPFDEQIKIAKYLDDVCRGIDVLIKEEQQQFETLLNYKKSIVYEYVTGKKRVKGAI